MTVESSNKYLAAVDGLRAIAVLSVVIFHLNSAWLPGGFTGVDIFFVISGYLITGIIADGLAKGRFGFSEFYARRIKRILPALYVVLLAVLATGFLLLTNDDFRYTLKSVIAVLVFVANIFFLRGRDYFDPNSSEIPLLHTWSLAVEEQFYFLWPLLLFVFYRKFKFKNLAESSGQQRLLRIAGLCIMLSLGYSCFLLYFSKQPSAAYFSTFSRAYELLIGAGLALFFRARPGVTISLRVSRILSLLGVMFMLVGFVFVDKDSGFPGLQALWPSIGAALVIMGANVKDNLVARWLSLSSLVFVGKISYSLYLWHWPILAFMRYSTGAEVLGIFHIVVAVVLSFVLSYASWRWIENSFRHVTWTNKQVFFRLLIVPGVALLVLVGSLKLNSDQIKAAQNPEVVFYGEEVCHRILKGPCDKGDVRSTKNPILVVGDSHAAHLNFFFEEYGLRHGLLFKVLSSSNCMPVFDFNTQVLQGHRQECEQLKEYFIENAKNYKTIIVAGRWDLHLGMASSKEFDPSFFAKFFPAIQTLAARGHQVYVMGQVPLLERHPDRIAKLARFGVAGDAKTVRTFADANKQISVKISRMRDVSFVPLSPYFENFDQGIYLNSQPMYMDNNHLNVLGARALGRLAAETPLFSVNPPRL